MRELDILMSGWLDRCYRDSSAAQQAAFRQLLELPDPEIHGWLTGRNCPDDPLLAELVDAIRRGCSDSPAV